jgi:hypothetical protein
MTELTVAESIRRWESRLEGLAVDDPERIRLQAMFWDMSHPPLNARSEVEENVS